MSLTTKKLLLFAAGAACIGLACLFFYSSLVTIPATNEWWKNESVQTSGTIVEVRQDYRNRVYVYYPVIEFRTAGGESIRFAPNIFSSSRDTYAPGRAIAVRYSRSNPHTAYIDSESLDTGTIWATVIFGAFLLLAGMGLVIAGMRKKPAAS
jgi:hypothetical protein